MTNPPDRAIKWTLNGDPDCRYDHWVGETPVGRILITWKGWKDDHVATLDAFPWAGGGDPFFWVGTPDEVKAACEAELMRRVRLMAAPIAAEGDDPAGNGDEQPAAPRIQWALWDDGDLVFTVDGEHTLQMQEADVVRLAVWLQTRVA